MTTLTMAADKIGLLNVKAWFTKLADKLEQRAKINRTIKELNRLTNKELDDIGLCRADIYSIANGKTDDYARWS